MGGSRRPGRGGRWRGTGNTSPAEKHNVASSAPRPPVRGSLSMPAKRTMAARHATIAKRALHLELATRSTATASQARKSLRGRFGYRQAGVGPLVENLDTVSPASHVASHVA